MAKKHAWGDYGYFVFRVLIGLLFAMHGAQKLFGWFGGKKAELMTMTGAAGVIELVVGLLVILGLFVSIAALIGAVEMLIAYFMVHFPQGWNPLMNKGEIALLYFAAFLILAAQGAKKWALRLDKK